MPNLVGFRTLIAAAAIAALGVAQTFDWTTVVTKQTGGLILIAIGAAIAALRVVTATPAGTQPAPTPETPAAPASAPKDAA